MRYRGNCESNKEIQLELGIWLTSEVYRVSEGSYYKVQGHLMSARVRIDFSVSFFLQGLLQRGLCKHPIRETARLRDLIHFVCFPHVYKAFTFLGVKEASLHHLTVQFQSLLLFF